MLCYTCIIIVHFLTVHKHHMHTYTEIITPPKNTIAFENQIAMFTCETDGGDITKWKINGTYLSMTDDDDLHFDHHPVEDSDNELFILNITARPMYNGTEVQCVTGDFGDDHDPVESEIVTLIIQGSYIYIIVMSCKYICTH